MRQERRQNLCAAINLPARRHRWDGLNWGSIICLSQRSRPVVGRRLNGVVCGNHAGHPSVVSGVTRAVVSMTATPVTCAGTRDSKSPATTAAERVGGTATLLPTLDKAARKLRCARRSLERYRAGCS